MNKKQYVVMSYYTGEGMYGKEINNTSNRRYYNKYGFVHRMVTFMTFAEATAVIRDVEGHFYTGTKLIMIKVDR